MANRTKIRKKGSKLVDRRWRLLAIEKLSNRLHDSRTAGVIRCKIGEFADQHRHAARAAQNSAKKAHSGVV